MNTSGQPRQVSVLDLTTLAQHDISTTTSRRAAWDQAHLIFALQGLANRKSPQLYVFWVGDNGSVDRYWLKKMQEPGEWLHDAKVESLASIDETLIRFRDCYEGLVVWDERIPATSNLASTIAGIENLLPVRYDPAADSLYTRLTTHAKLPVRRRLFNDDGTPLFTGKGQIADTALTSTASTKCDAYLWASEKYQATKLCNPAKLGYYPDAFWLTGMVEVPFVRSLLSNHDYFIAHRAFFFDVMPWDDDKPRDDPDQPLGADYQTLLSVLRAAYEGTGGREMIHSGGFTPWDQKYTTHTGEKHDGVPTEWRHGEILSCFNAYMDADAAGYHEMANASFFQHYPLKEKYPQTNLPTTSTLTDAGWLSADNTVTSKTYVSIYVGDYDSAAWLYRKLPEFWEDSVRGTIPLGWAFNPNLADRFAFGMAYFRKTASKMDTFVAGDCGAGYLNPGFLTPPRIWSGLPSGLDAWERHCTQYYRQWDISVTGFIIDGYAPEMSAETRTAYTRFSPRGFVIQNLEGRAERGMAGDTPFIRMMGDLASDPESNAQAVVQSAPKATGFAMYRTILWSPSEHKALMARVKELRPDIEFVDPHALMLLLRTYLEGRED